MVGIAMIIWIFTGVLVLWVWSDATIRHGPARGLLWTGALLLSGPIGLIAYLTYGRRED